MGSFKRLVFRFLNEDNVLRSGINSAVNGFIMLLIVLSLAEIILESFHSLSERWIHWLRVFEVFVVVVFTIEYLLRLWIADLRFPHLSAARARWKVATSFSGIIDLVAILPFYLPFFIHSDLRVVRTLRLVRLLRIFKLNRHSASLRLVGQVLREKGSELSITVVVAFLLMLLSAALMYDIESEVQPDKFPNILATLWWAISTLTTVGYGDVYPVTVGGKVLAGIIALLGIGLVALPAGILSSAFMEKLKTGRAVETPDENIRTYRYCPHCGEPLDG